LINKLLHKEKPGMELKNRKCVPCEGGIPPLTENEVKEYLKLVGPAWHVHGNKKMERKFHFVNFKHTMKFINRVAEIAELEGHHPDMHVHYGECEIELWTHAIDGLSENDFILAAKIDDLL
jgi:4a-hydroxytetrahydrobiopterin dehydratase